MDEHDHLNRSWWKEAVIYQIYPRSFKDSNGDGIGDLKGIYSKLSYIKKLGVDAVWLGPIFDSPNEDNGYDISDYRSIAPDFGSMEDFDQLLEEFHAEGIKLILDLVPNHCSVEHPWFKQARSSRDNPYRNYFHWWNAEDGEPPHRWSFFDIEGSAWAYDLLTHAYYLHYFSKNQPDLNWENPAVREEIYNVMDFWLQKGVDGFRVDVISFISKDTNFPALPSHYIDNDFVKYYASGPFIHQYLQELNQRVVQKYNAIIIGEGIGISADAAMQYLAPEREEINLLYHCDGIDLGYLPGKFKVMDPTGYDLASFKEIYTRWDEAIIGDSRGTIFLGNHDQPRMVSRWGNDSPEFRQLSSTLLTTFLLTMRATPFYYAGDELGMNNIKFDSIEDYRDLETLNMYEKLERLGGDTNAFIQSQKNSGRDNSRTPFQWSGDLYAGFSDVAPWLKVNENFFQVNVLNQDHDPASPLNYFRSLIKVRKENLGLIYGTYQLLDVGNDLVYAYTRQLSDKKYLILLNFSSLEALIQLPDKFLNAVCLLGNYSAEIYKNNLSLRPYEAVISLIV